MKQALMSGIKLYQQAVLNKQHAGETFVVKFRDQIDPDDEKYNSMHLITVDADYYAKKGNALVVKGSISNLLESEPRMIDAFMRGMVLERVER